MTSLISLLIFIAPSPSSAAPTQLLDCNMNFGIDQQAVVTVEGNALTLRELTNSGSWVTRSMTTEEWKSQKIRLRSTDGETGVLYKNRDGRGWSYETTQGSHVTVKGVADCR